MIKIGKSESEYVAEQSLECREIVKKIHEHGVNEQQILQLAYLLSLELENREAMLDISHVIKKYLHDLSEDKNSDIIT